MNRMILAVFLVAGAAHASRQRAAMPPQFPPCRVVTGTPAVTFSRDGGATTIPRAMALDGIGYTYGVAALDTQTILSAYNDAVSISHDAGCSWRFVGRVTGPDLFPPSITPARDGSAYIWSDNRPILARYTAAGLKMLKAPGPVVGLGVDATRVRIVDAYNNVWTSSDQGESWERVPEPVGIRPINVYRGAFDPANLDHFLKGMQVDGAAVTFDGARTWEAAAGISAGFNVFNIVVSPADPNVVWAMALNTADGARHIFRSTNGGRSFVPVIDSGNGVTLLNGPVMAAHPTDPNVLYFVFGTYFQGYGTDLFRYDAATRELQLMHHNFHDIDAIGFSPADPNVMYFGLEVVDGPAP